MTVSDPLSITLGVEEECFLVDPDSLDLVRDPDPGFLDACQRNAGPHKVVPELLRCQVETNTRVCTSIAELAEARRDIRRILVETAAQYGMKILAISTHPFADWQVQGITRKERYQRLTTRMQDVVRRALIGGMHIHAGFGNADQRVRVMTALRQYLPVFNALSASSAFSESRDTGFKSWRLSVFGGLPRTGVPGPLASAGQYEQVLDRFRHMELISDGSELWWDIRPSHAFPTVELRICDTVPLLDDGTAIAALYASLIRRLMRLDADGSLRQGPPVEIISENRWLAQRYGTLAFLGAEAGGREDIDDIVTRLIDEVSEDAEALGCADEVARMHDIIRFGTAADRQVDLYRLRRLEKSPHDDALRAVVESMIEESTRGL